MAHGQAQAGTVFIRTVTSARRASGSSPSPTRSRPSATKVNLDIFWLKDDALEGSANLPASEIIATDITADLEAALEQFATIAEDLKK